MNWKLIILGSNAATPTTDRNPSAQVLSCDNRLFLIDCGEGTQMQMRKFKVKFQRIDHIFISHLHGDHYLGLMGLLFTLHLSGRNRPLHVYANAGLRHIIDLQLKASDSTLLYPLVFHELPVQKACTLFEDERLCISCFPLLHRVPTHGFLFRQKLAERNLNKEKIDQLQIPVTQLDAIKKGSDYTDKKGITYLNAALTLEPPPPKIFAYCSDTAYNPSIVRYIEKASLLYHEATFMHDRQTNAGEKQHSTTIQAATIAKQAKAGKLLIGHFSARYDELTKVIEETRSVFPDADLAIEGNVYKI
ncbi:MAG TPA: ribonuclease Z [Bacteroidales bacterium]|nr:ribonuclease Z [Bacteroidales bacterium]HQI71129.1 ribonuclease Z [Bacteroidales bacterium]